MSEILPNTSALYYESFDTLLQGMKRAVREAVLDHKRAGNPIATWQDGKVVIVPPEEIELPDEEEIVENQNKAAEA